MFVPDFCDESEITDLEIHFRFVGRPVGDEDVGGLDVAVEEPFRTDFLKARANLETKQNTFVLCFHIKANLGSKQNLICFITVNLLAK